MKFYIRTLIFVGFLFILGGCATLFYGTKKPIYITSQPVNTPVYINNKYVGETPLLVNQKYSSGKHFISVRLSDSETDKHNFLLDKKFRPVSLIGLPAVIPFVVDMATGAAKAHNSNTYTHNFDNPDQAYSWKFQLVYQSDSFAVDPLNVIERPKYKSGFTTAKPSTEQNFSELFGYGLNGVYQANDTSFTIGAKTLFRSDNGNKRFKGMDIPYYTAFSSTTPGLEKLLYSNEIVPVAYHLVALNKIKWIEEHTQKALTAQIPEEIKNAGSAPALPSNLHQYWLEISRSGDKTILFQAIDLKSKSELTLTLSEELRGINNYFMFLVKGQGQLIEISADELKENVALFSNNPYLLALADLSSSGNDLMVRLNKNTTDLTNILNWEWANKTGDPFFEIFDAKLNEKMGVADSAKTLPKRTKEPAVVTENSNAVAENKEKLDQYTGKAKELKPSGAGTPEDDSYKYYGSEAPWYLQGQLKPEYRQTAGELGYDSEEIYNPAKKQIDSTAWLKEQQFELLFPEIDSTYKAGYDPGYINPDDPRKKPQEQNGTPWYLQKSSPKKEQQEALKKVGKEIKGKED